MKHLSEEVLIPVVLFFVVLLGFGIDAYGKYLDAISEDGIHYTAEMSPGIEKWLVFTKQWSANRQQPYD